MKDLQIQSEYYVSKHLVPLYYISTFYYQIVQNFDSVPEIQSIDK